MDKNGFIPFGMKVLCVLSYFMPVIQKFGRPLFIG